MNSICCTRSASDHEVKTGVKILMSRVLQIFRAKPNPAGKDKAGSYPKPEQLLGEWVDIKNVGTEAVPFGTMALTHTLFNDYCQRTGKIETYFSGSSADTQSLAPGQVLRIHTGRKSDEAHMKYEDKKGRDWWNFANSDQFKLNNRCGDAIVVSWKDAYGRDLQDAAEYERNQPEGAILVRSGSKLVRASAVFGR